MAVVYRHQILGSSKQINDFCINRKSELATALEQWQSEYDMWVEIDKRPGAEVPAAVYAHLRSRQRNLGHWMHEAKVELAIIEELRASCAAPCPGCNGYGFTLQQVYQDESTRHQCSQCRGSGTTRPTA